MKFVRGKVTLTYTGYVVMEVPDDFDQNNPHQEFEQEMCSSFNKAAKGVDVTCDAGDFEFVKPELNLDDVFHDAPGNLGLAWRRMGHAENALAVKLDSIEASQGVILGSSVWFLDLQDDGRRVLCHSVAREDGYLTEISSRLDWDLMWVDVTEEDLIEQAQSIEQATEKFEVVTIRDRYMVKESDKKITSVRITEMPKSILDPMPEVFATLDDGTEQKLFSFYPDEISFNEAELVGLTVPEAIGLRHKKDVDFLRS